MAHFLLFTPSKEVVLCTFLSVIILFLTYILIKYIKSKKSNQILKEHTSSISDLQKKLWLTQERAYYNFSQKNIVDQTKTPIFISKYKEVLILQKFIGNELPSQAIRVGISEFSPQEKYNKHNIINVYLYPISGTDIWKVKYINADNTIFSHPIMGTLTIENVPSNLSINEEVKIYQRVIYIGKDCLVQYEVRKD